MNYKLSLSPLFALEIIASALFIVFFGFGNFLFFILLSMIFGVVLLGVFWKNILEFQMGDLKDMLTQFSFVIAGFLLVFPGIITSVFGIFVFLFGIALKIMTKSKYQYTKQERQNSNEEIIDVEIIEDRK
ncbi:integral memnbrane protein [Campylobacter jejuni]|nr:integral memnbrane protein [Campylobacter jejuni]EHN6901915.1 integral memnbrane protein [Campylobacter jejuni]EHN6916116.1 integral memnbrane protein [Campylobacter jejuni]